MWRDQLARAFSTAACVVVLLGLAAIGAAPMTKAMLNPAPRNVMVVRDIDPGGQIGTYDMWWHRVADSGALVVVDGDCVSACALLMGIIPPSRVCLTERAAFGLHMASQVNQNGDREPNQEVTDWMVRRYYPAVVIAWIFAHNGLTDEVQYMKPVDFDGFYRQCKKEEYNPWPTEAPH